MLNNQMINNVLHMPLFGSKSHSYVGLYLHSFTQSIQTSCLSACHNMNKLTFSRHVRGREWLSVMYITNDDLTRGNLSPCDIGEILC